MKLIYSFLFLTILASCSIDSTIHFNKNYSGSVRTEYDFSAFSSFSGDEMNLSELLQDEDFKRFKDSINLKLNQQGFANFDINFEENDYNKMNISYDFDGIKSLNSNWLNNNIANLLDENLQDEGEQEFINSMNPTYKKDGKWMIIELMTPEDFDQFKKELLSQSQEVSPQELEMQMDLARGMFSMMMESNQVYTFDRKIKNIETDLQYSYNKKEKSITLKQNIFDLFDIIEEGKKAQLRIRLK